MNILNLAPHAETSLSMLSLARVRTGTHTYPNPLRFKGAHQGRRTAHQQHPTPKPRSTQRTRQTGIPRGIMPCLTSPTYTNPLKQRTPGRKVKYIPGKTSHLPRHSSPCKSPPARHKRAPAFKGPASRSRASRKGWNALCDSSPTVAVRVRVTPTRDGRDGCGGRGH